MPRDNSIKKVLVIGSGPIVIGQAAEFDQKGKTRQCTSNTWRTGWTEPCNGT